MTQLWKSTKVALDFLFLMISTSYLEKPPQKNASALPHLPQPRRRRLIIVNIGRRAVAKPIDIEQENSPVEGAHSPCSPVRYTLV
jgi:hypothetical protein